MSRLDWRRSHADDDGISLVEVLVSIMLLGIALAAFAGTITSALGAIVRDEQFVMGTQLAADLIEETRALPWGCIGFDASDGDYVDTGNTVQIDDTTCTGAAYDARPTVTDEGEVGDVQYQVTRSIEWVDADGVAGTQNHKQLTVQLDWTVRGNPYTTSTTSLRIPTPNEVPIADVTEAPCTPGSIRRLSVTPAIVAIASSGATSEPISVVVETCGPASVVTLDRPPLATFPLEVDPESGGTRWTHTFASGTPNFVAGAYDWTAIATPAGSATPTTAVQSMTFFVQDALVSLDVTAITPVGSFCVDENGTDKDRLRTAVTVDITVQGLTAADAGTVVLGWTSVNDSTLATFISSSGSSSTWTATVPARRSFSGGSTTLSASAIRFEDNAVASETVIQTLTLRKHNEACP